MKKVYIEPQMESIAFNNNANLLAGSGKFSGDGADVSIKSTGASGDAQARGGFFDDSED